MQERYDEVKKIIEEAGDLVDFAEFGNGCSDEWIKKAEDRLGVEFPPTYKWWLRNYCCGEVCGNEIFSVYEMDFDTVVGGDIVYMHELNQKQGIYKPYQLFIVEQDDDAFYFDLSKKNEDGEYPVYQWFGESQFYAKDFLEFLKKRIECYQES